VGSYTGTDGTAPPDGIAWRHHQRSWGLRWTRSETF
jgi:hypothetical protein